LKGRGPDVAADLLHELPLELAVAALDALEDHLRGLDEDLPAVLLVDAEALELDAAEAAPDAEDEAAVAHVVEHDDLLGDPHRVVPGRTTTIDPSWMCCVLPA
jgi:hypothetical protein